MNTSKNTKLEIDSNTIEALLNLCELSGLEKPDLITTDFLRHAAKRIKDIFLSFKKQVEEVIKQIEIYKNESTELKSCNEDYKKQIEELTNNTEDYIKQLEELKTTNENYRIQLTEVKKQVEGMKDKISRKESNSNLSFEEEEEEEEEAEEDKKQIEIPKINNILIIANLGVIMHQLKILFSKFGCTVTLVKTYKEAVDKLKETPFECIMIDISAVSDQDLKLIEATRKATDVCHPKPLILALIVAIKDKAVKKNIKSKDADIVIEKDESWHNNLLKELKLVS